MKGKKEISVEIENEELEKLLNIKFEHELTNMPKISNPLIIKSILNSADYQIIIKGCHCCFFVIYLNRIGKYKDAYDLINRFINEGNKKPELFLCMADTLHLMNYYQTALELLNLVIHDQNAPHLFTQSLFLQAHIYKHLGKFELAISKIKSIKAKEHKTNVLKKLVSLYYLQYLDCKLKNSIESAEGFYKLAEETNNLIAEEADAHSKIYEAALLARNNPLDALSLIEACIEHFEAENDRLIFNAYYVKAEILRVMNRYDEAYKYYGLSSGIYCNHSDINLIDQNYFSAKYLEKRKFVRGLLSKQLEKKVRVENKAIYDYAIANHNILLGDMQKEKDNEPVFNLLIKNTINKYSLSKKTDELDEMMIDTIFIIL